MNSLSKKDILVAIFMNDVIIHRISSQIRANINTKFREGVFDFLKKMTSCENVKIIFISKMNLDNTKIILKRLVNRQISIDQFGISCNDNDSLHEYYKKYSNIVTITSIDNMKNNYKNPVYLTPFLNLSSDGISMNFIDELKIELKIELETESNNSKKILLDILTNVQ